MASVVRRFFVSLKTRANMPGARDTATGLVVPSRTEGDSIGLVVPMWC